MSVQNEHSEGERGSRSLLSNSRVMKAHDGFCLFGKALIVNSQSVVVAYLKVPLLSDSFGILKGLALIMTADAYASLRASIPGD